LGSGKIPNPPRGAEWIVTCDQPFDKVEKAEFIALLKYTHHSSFQVRFENSGPKGDSGAYQENAYNGESRPQKDVRGT
jgi:hypothetical protein